MTPMQNSTKTPLRLYFSIFFFVFLLMLFFRLAFWCIISQSMDDPTSADVLKALYIGLRFDARIAALFTLPFALAACVPSLIRKLHEYAFIVAMAYAPFFFILILIYSADLGFYFYLGGRITRLVFELLEDFNEAVEMVVQSYPVPLIALGIFLTTAFCIYIVYRILRTPVRPNPNKYKRAAGFIFGFLFFALAVYGQLNASLFPLRWSNAFFTTEEDVIALGLNPVQSLYDTYGSDTKGFSREEATTAYPAIADFLLVDKPDMQTLNYLRRLPPKAASGSRAPNIVIIIMESLSYPKTSFAPGSADPTPHLRNLAQESLLFHRYFASSRTTARAVFSIITGLPDVNIGSTGSRNPLVVDQRVVANEFKDYNKYYLIGGNTSWANIRAVLAQNIQNLRILEENSWKAPRVDVWGVSDYDLLQEAHQLFAAQTPDKPFLAVIQTASYHRPYTIPPTPGFTMRDIPEEEMLAYGFEDAHEYNSMRYSDYAVGAFMRQAKKEKYYENTVFFIFGDHGLNDPCKNMPASYQEARLYPWHVPLLIHTAPALGLVTPGESWMPASHVDIFPTAAGLAGITYNNRTMGRDLFDQRYDGSRIAYIGGKNAEGIRLVYEDYCYFDNLLGSHFLYRLTDTVPADISGSSPKIYNKLKGAAEAMDATIRYMLFNNKKTEQQRYLLPAIRRGMEPKAD